MAEGLEGLLEALSDGEWHSIEELAGRLKMAAADVEEAARLLAKYGMALYDAGARRVRLTEPVLRLMRGGA
jgi:DNA-binding IclR family transcriptional regulator